jgi:hypothetical protein
MIFDNLDDYELEQLPPEDETQARHQAQECRDIFNRPLPATRPLGQTKLDFGQQEEMFGQ